VFESKVAMAIVCHAGNSQPIAGGTRHCNATCAAIELEPGAK